MVTEAAPSLGYLWLVPAAPFLAFVVIGLVTRPWRHLSAAISIVAIGTSFLFSLGAFFSQLHQGVVPRLVQIDWFVTATMKPSAGLLLDPLSAVMLVVVTTVGLLVQIYSLGYMAEEKGLSRFYAYLSLFCASMLGLVLAGNFLQLFVFWELVGLCSYLLIGFWYDRDAPAFAAKKAFVTTRLGDLGFLIGVLMLVTQAGSFDFGEVQRKMVLEAWDPKWTGMAALLLFCGAVGKSAQFPLHVWLPDAMEGPTPVSALIHAATMVAAGVFMVARLFAFFSADPETLALVAKLGAFTALFAASIALVQDDLKRVLAWSTVSQLGYMMLALGVGALSAGMFHLWTHAFFKALLFLGAGAVIHSVHSNSMRDMGGLKNAMPWTAGIFAVGSLALAGIFPLSGFFSKDLILTAVEEKSRMLFWVAVATAGLTGFYVGRSYILTFLGTSRSKVTPHETPWVMRAPLLILAALAVGSGWWMGGFSQFVYFGAPSEVSIHFLSGLLLMLPPAAGLAFSWTVYVRNKPSPEWLASTFSPIYNLLRHGYYVDDFMNWVINNMVMGLSRALAWFDRNVVDGAVNGVAWISRKAGDVLRLLQTGQVQHYALAVFGGAILLVLIAKMAGAH